MTPEHLFAAGLAAAVLLATLRLLWSVWRTPAARRPRPWRIGAILLLQALAAGLLHATLLPPRIAVPAGTLTVLTAGASLPDTGGGPVVALPGARGVPPATPRAPDLATALRRHPGTARVHVVGHGLEAHDRDALGTLALSFAPAPMPPGVVGLWAPATAMAGARIVVRGRVAGMQDAMVALQDPAGQRVSSQPVGDDGGFALEATMRGPGEALFQLVLVDAAGRDVERLQVPVSVEPAPPLRLMLRAGAPNPELRALRRWAEDAGMALRWEAALGAGARVGDGRALDAATLDALDLLVLDARAWDALGASQRRVLEAAMRDGLGVLVQLADAPSPALRNQLRALDLDVRLAAARSWQPASAPDDRAQLRARLGPGSADAPFDPALAGETPPRLGYRPLQGEGAPFHASPAPADTGRWQAVGQGRLGVVTLADSYHLVQAGRADLHAQLWADWAATLARPHIPARARIEPMRVGTRGALCELDGEAGIVAPDGSRMPLLPDPRADGCAAFWPRVAGWHRLDTGGASDQAFHVDAAGAAPALQAARLQAATAARVGGATAGGALAGPMRRGASWPWFLGLLATLALLWTLERGRRGLPPPVEP